MTRESNNGTTPRVWQACINCRRKKVKCDGSSPCYNCSSRDLSCEYPGSNDNASNSRSYVNVMESRFQQLEVLCQKLEILTTQLTNAIEKMPKEVISNRPQEPDVVELTQIPHELHALLEPEDLPPSACQMEPPVHDPSERPGGFYGELDMDDQGSPHMGILNEESDDDLENEPVDLAINKHQTHEIFGSLIPDSYGSMRFIGGASNELLVRAIQKLTPTNSMISISTASPMILQGKGTPVNFEKAQVENPLFLHGQQWRELSYLPKPGDLGLPPQYTTNILVDLYFDQFHHTFPVLYKPRFMDQYKRLYTDRRDTPRPSGFLSVFFAVCACASGLVASDRKQPTFLGLDYYEKSLLLHFSTTGQATIERTQCLALLSMCCSGWNALSSSWHFAGQAVRAAQDLGLHLDKLTSPDTRLTNPNEALLEAEITRRIWWSIYCLDRTTSICLGRPVAANDTDCSCALPLPVADEDITAVCGQPLLLDSWPTSKLPLSGFLAFSKLCQISGKIHNFQSPSRVANLCTPKGQMRMMRLARKMGKYLDQWLNDLPDHIRFSANTPGRGPNLTMCIIVFVIQAGSLLNLFSTFSSRKGSFEEIEPAKNCISAARSCINAAELLRDFVPPSHYMALCVHYITTSGLALLYLKDHYPGKPDPDVEKCLRFMQDLEGVWLGASRGRAIIEKTLKLFAERQSAPVDFGQNLFLIPSPDSLHLDAFGTGHPNMWGFL